MRPVWKPMSFPSRIIELPGASSQHPRNGWPSEWIWANIWFTDCRCVVGRALGHIADYGRMEVASEDLGLEQAILVVLNSFGNWCFGDGRRAHRRARVWCRIRWGGCGYLTEVVYTFCRQSGERFRPAVGRGLRRYTGSGTNRPYSDRLNCEVPGRELPHELDSQ